MQYTEISIAAKLKSFHYIFVSIFLSFVQNIDRGYALGGSNEYPQSMFWIKSKKNCIPVYTNFLLCKSTRGVFIAWVCLHDGKKVVRIATESIFIVRYTREVNV